MLVMGNLIHWLNQKGQKGWLISRGKFEWSDAYDHFKVGNYLLDEGDTVIISTALGWKEFVVRTNKIDEWSLEGSSFPPGFFENCESMVSRYDTDLICCLTRQQIEEEVTGKVEEGEIPF